MDCSTCQKPVEIGQPFISGFDPERNFYLKHANCAGITSPAEIKRRCKVMNQLRLDSLRLYEDQKKKASEQVSPAEP